MGGGGCLDYRNFTIYFLFKCSRGSVVDTKTEKAACCSTAVKRSASAQYEQIQWRQITGKFKTLFQKKIKQFLEREALNVEFLWRSSSLFTSDFIASYFGLSLHSSKASLRISLRKRFELIQIFKALTTGCDVGFYV